MRLQLYLDRSYQILKVFSLLKTRFLNRGIIRPSYNKEKRISRPVLNVRKPEIIASMILNSPRSLQRLHCDSGVSEATI